MGPRLCCFVVLAGCAFPSRSSGYLCDTTADCEDGRVCDNGYCIKASDSEFEDAAIMVDGPQVDAAPDSQTLAMQCEAAGYVFVANANGYYRKLTTNMTWANAQATCKSHVANATHLIVLSNVQEETYMTTQATGWIGLGDAATEGTYVTVTGEVGDRRPWGAGEPDTDGDCVRMDPDARIWVAACGDNHAFVCECDGKASTP